MFKFLAAVSVFALCSVCFAESSLEYIKAHAILSIGERIPAQVAKDLENKKLILLGEWHGTMQMPALAGQVLEDLAKYRKPALGVEFPAELQPQLDLFLKTGDENVLRETEFFKDVAYGSGRTTIAMVDLLQTARRLHLSVFGFDVPYGVQPPDRDARMAKNILRYMKLHPRTQVVTYSGNYHSAFIPDSMAGNILATLPAGLSAKNIDNIDFRLGGGSAWGCTDDGKPCGIHTQPPATTAYNTANASWLYYLVEQAPRSGVNRTIYVRSTLASLPFNYFEPRCHLTPKIFESYLKLDYEAFDQTLPDGGWRSLSYQQCDLEGARLIDAYRTRNASSLLEGQTRILNWHAGQLFAQQENYVLAIDRFRSSLDPAEQPDDRFKWNAYVNGSIAFLQNDREELVRNQHLLEQAPDAGTNLEIINSFVRCFGAPYSKAYSSNCGVAPAL